MHCEIEWRTYQIICTDCVHRIADRWNITCGSLALFTCALLIRPASSSGDSVLLFDPDRSICPIFIATFWIKELSGDAGDLFQGAIFFHLTLESSQQAYSDCDGQILQSSSRLVIRGGGATSGGGGALTKKGTYKGKYLNVPIHCLHYQGGFQCLSIILCSWVRWPKNTFVSDGKKKIGRSQCEKLNLIKREEKKKIRMGHFHNGRLKRPVIISTINVSVHSERAFRRLLLVAWN